MTMSVTPLSGKFAGPTVGKHGHVGDHIISSSAVNIKLSIMIGLV